MYHCTLFAAQIEAPPTSLPFAFLLMMETQLSFISFSSLRTFGFSNHKGRRHTLTHKHKFIEMSNRKRKRITQDEKMRSCSLNILASL